jgi:hypothetical protein
MIALKLFDYAKILGCCLLGIQVASCSKQEPPPVPPAFPPELSVPHNARLLKIWTADGLQPYSCFSGTNGVLAWEPGKPTALMKETDGSPAGRQDGLTWTLPQGTSIVGKVAGHATVEGKPAYLFITAVPGGSETDSRIRYIQRIVLNSASAPKEACNDKHLGDVVYELFTTIDYIYQEIGWLLPGACGELRQSCCQRTVVSGNLPHIICVCHEGFDCNPNTNIVAREVFTRR